MSVTSVRAFEGGRRYPLPGLAAFCSTLLPPEAGGPDPRGLATDVERFAAHLPALSRNGLRLGVASAAALGPRAPSQIVDTLKTVVLLVAGSQAGATELRAWSGEMPLSQPDPVLDVTPFSRWPARSRADVVVIGSGAGGAMAARTLSRAGMRVVVIEEGRRFAVDEFRTRHPLERWVDLYRDAGSTTTFGSPPVLLPLGRGVGGTTLVNSGTCYRPPQNVLLRWRDRHGLGLADPDAITPFVEDVWRTINAEPVSLDVMGRNGQLALEGARSLGWHAAPLDHNAVNCGGCCQSAIGCPRNAKNGVWLNALPEACDAGARILTHAWVERVVHERGRATGVVARNHRGRAVRIDAPRVVVACGATETPLLLRRSGLGRHPALGANLSIHPALAMLARFDEPVTAWRGVLQSAGVEAPHAEGVLMEATSAPFGMGWTSFPGSGPDLLRELDRAEQYGSLGALIADRSSGRVDGRRHALIRYPLHPDDVSKLRQAVHAIGGVLLAAGAREVITPLPGARVVRSDAELVAGLDRFDPRRLRLAGFHPVGTAAAGADAERHPVREDGRLRGVEGLWVADASILPSCPEVNPQVTIMALALAVAGGIASAA